MSGPTEPTSTPEAGKTDPAPNDAAPERRQRPPGQRPQHPRPKPGAPPVMVRQRQPLWQTVVLVGIGVGILLALGAILVQQLVLIPRGEEANSLYMKHQAAVGTLELQLRVERMHRALGQYEEARVAAASAFDFYHTTRKLEREFFQTYRESDVDAEVFAYFKGKPKSIERKMLDLADFYENVYPTLVDDQNPQTQPGDILPDDDANEPDSNTHE